MSLRLAEGPLGPPWRRPLAGRLDQLTVESELLAGNPLGDPARRPLYVYSSPGVGSDPVPVVYMLQGFTNQLDTWLARRAFEPTVVERLDAMFAAEESPPGRVVFIDAWTSRGGSQFLNSSANGPYLDYLCEEIVPFVDARYPTRSEPGWRGVAGGSSGGYGALILSMLRPDVFGALGSVSGDALFEACYQPDFPRVARTLRDHFDGSFERFFEEFARADRFDFARFGDPLNTYAMACAYSPDPERPGWARLPFDIDTGQLVSEVWAQWLEHDPVRMAAHHAEALRSLRLIRIDAGRSDEYFLDLAAQALARELEGLGIAHRLELFDGPHGGIRYRYPSVVAELVRALG